MEKKIITLGLPSSGKSCYMSVAVSYMFREKMYDIASSSNSSLRMVADEIEERMQSGQWVEKTIGREEYTFTKKGRFIETLRRSMPDPLAKIFKKKGWFETSYVLHDWNGEYFRKLGLNEDQASGEWNKAQEKINGDIVKGDDLRKLYETDCREADAILLFIDAKTLLDAEDRSATRNSLNTLTDILNMSEKKRVIAIVLTKVDYLEESETFCRGDKMIDIEKVENYLQSKYNSFFSVVISNRHRVSVSAVSCIPVKAHRNNKRGHGTLPNKDWTLKDLSFTIVDGGKDERFGNDMLTPIRWTISYT